MDFQSALHGHGKATHLSPSSQLLAVHPSSQFKSHILLPGKEHLAGFWVPPQETLVQSTEMKQLLLPPFYAHPILLQWIPSEDVSFLPILQSQYGIKTV